MNSAAVLMRETNSMVSASRDPGADILTAACRYISAKTDRPVRVVVGQRRQCLRNTRSCQAPVNRYPDDAPVDHPVHACLLIALSPAPRRGTQHP